MVGGAPSLSTNNSIQGGSGGGDYWTGRQAGGEQKTQGEREKPGNLICVNNRFSIHSIVGPSEQSRERKMICMRWEEEGREGIWGERDRVGAGR